MGNVTVIGLDLAKSVFQVHGVDEHGSAVLRQRLTRARLLKFSPSCRLAWWAWRRARRRTSGHVS